MDKLFIGQLWDKYAETKDVEWLAQAVELADFGLNERKEKLLKTALADFIRANNGKKQKAGNSLRDKTVRDLHQINLQKGMSKTESYRAIANQFTEWANTDNSEIDDFVHTTLSSEAVRKILNPNRKKS